MGFWIFMFVMDLLIPLTMIGFGRLFIKRAPGEVNGVFGYRTFMSMKNKDTWEFAHKYFGKLWYVSGLITLVITVIALIPVIGATKNTIGLVGGIVCGIQMIPLIVTIIPTEIALNKEFDKTGNKR